MTKKTIFIIESSQTIPNIIINFFDKEWQDKICLIGLEDFSKCPDNHLPIIDNYLNQTIPLPVVKAHEVLVVRVTNFESFKESTYQEILDRVACFITNKGEFTYYAEKIEPEPFKPMLEDDEKDLQGFRDELSQLSMAEWEMIKACMDGTRKSWK